MLKRGETHGVLRPELPRDEGDDVDETLGAETVGPMVAIDDSRASFEHVASVVVATVVEVVVVVVVVVVVADDEVADTLDESLGWRYC
jgi:hypothetical protein